MAALTAGRKVLVRGDETKIKLLATPVKAATRIYDGAIVVSDGGYAAPARTATGLICIGIAIDTYDNSSGAAGAKIAETHRCTAKFSNSAAADLITQAACYTPCYLVDDSTVALTNGGGTRSVAGVIMQVDSDGVWVELGGGTL
jgi:hypothetical protein